MNRRIVFWILVVMGVVVVATLGANVALNLGTGYSATSETDIEIWFGTVDERSDGYRSNVTIGGEKRVAPILLRDVGAAALDEECNTLDDRRVGDRNLSELHDYPVVLETTEPPQYIVFKFDDFESSVPPEIHTVTVRNWVRNETASGIQYDEYETELVRYENGSLEYNPVPANVDEQCR
jgi:hypothetical protein